jgi:hypothetical protein
MTENGLESAEAAKVQANQHFKGTAGNRCCSFSELHLARQCL